MSQLLSHHHYSGMRPPTVPGMPLRREDERLTECLRIEEGVEGRADRLCGEGRPRGSFLCILLLFFL